MIFAPGTKCSTKVSDNSPWPNYSSCSKKPVIERDGKPYCTIHDPEYIKEKRRKRAERWDAESKASDERYTWEHARNKAVLGLTLEELQRVTPQMIREMSQAAEKLRDLEIYRQAGAD